MKKWIWAIIINMICSSTAVMAIPTVVPDQTTCFRDLELHFFDATFVNQGLNFYNIREESWFLINNMLQAKSLEVPQRMKIKTAYMVPNPMEYPMQKGVTAKILKQVLFEIFMETMQANYVNERPTVDLVFDYIFLQQLPKFVACFGEEARKLEPKFE